MSTIEYGAEVRPHATDFGHSGMEHADDGRTSGFARLYFDRLGNASRPKLIFTITAADIALAMASVLGSVAAFDRLPTLADGVSALLVAIAFAVAMKATWAYTIPALRRPPGQAQRIVKSALLAFGMVGGLGYLVGLVPFSPGAGLLALAGTAALTIAMRFPVARVLDGLTRAGRLVRRTIVVGGGADAETLIRTLESERQQQVQILGVFDDRTDERSADSFCGYPKLGNFDQLAAFCRNTGVDLLIVTVPTTAEHRLLQILERLFAIPVDIRISALSSKLRLSSRAYTHIGSVPMLAVMDRPLTDWDRAIKNIEDRVIGALLLLAAAPVMLVVAALIRLTSKGPVLFKQRRYGFNNELIEVYKFRSMFVEKTDADASKLVTKDDPRVTPVGRFIRKTSLDELPQLFNVLKGEMSLVGPRPHATGAKADADLYQNVVCSYFARHRVKPGVTGWAQINGWRGETDTHEKIQRRVEHDLHYIDNWSLGLDLYIIAMTPLSLISGRNAY